MANEFETEGIKIGAGVATVDGEDLQTQLPSADEKAALAGTGTPAAGDPYVNDSDGRIPTTDEKAALAGTGTPAAGDPYVNDSDSRMSDARDPNAHNTTHESGGADEIHKEVPSNSDASTGAFTSSGGGTWEDVTGASVDVTLVDAGAILAMADVDCEANAGTAVEAQFRVVIDGNNGGPIATDLLAAQDAKALHVHHLQAGLAVGARTCKLQVMDDGVTAVKVNRWIISAFGLQV